MPVTEKISVAMGRAELDRARKAAEAEGVSLSAYITHAVRDRLKAHAEALDREKARLEMLATFLPHELPTEEEAAALDAYWNRQGPEPDLSRKRAARKVAR
jgi:hypothetical protein